MRSKDSNMLSGPLFGSIVRYTIPIILTSWLQLLFHAADLIVVGQFCGSISLAAVGSTGSIINLLVNFFIGLSVGVGVTVAHGIGSHIDDDVKNAIHTALPIAFVCGGLLTVIGITYTEKLLLMMGTPSNVLPLSVSYMRIYFGGVLFTIVYNYCAAILRAAGDTKSPLLFLMIAGVANVVLNVIFVRFFHMNVSGVALATVISQVISSVLVIRALMIRTDACKLDLKQIGFRKKPLLKIIRIGLPAAIQNSLFGISNVTIQSSINSFGDVFMSGNAAATNLEGFLNVTMTAFSQTAVNFIGQNAGARQHKRVLQTLWICMGCITVAGLTMGCIFYLFAPSLLSIYISDSAAAISYGLIRIMIVHLPYFIFGLMDVSTGALRGLGSSVIPMVISILGVCGLRVGWVCTIFQIPRFHTPQWLYISYPISWTITFACQILAFIIVYRKKAGSVAHSSTQS